MAVPTANAGAGQGMSQQAQQLLQNIMANKQVYGSATPGQQQQLAAQNQGYYNQLSNMLGQNVQGLIGSGVGYQQAQANISKLFPQQTAAGSGQQPAQQQDPSVSLGQLAGMSSQWGGYSNPSVPVEQAKYQTPQQISQLYNQMQSVLQPITNAQMKQQQDAFNGNMQTLDSKFARNGLLASGAAAGAETSAANTLNDQLQKFQADQNSQALTMGNDYANLGLKEAQQIFDQQMANANLGMNSQKQNFDQALQTYDAQQATQKQGFDEGIQQAGVTGVYYAPGTAGAPTGQYAPSMVTPSGTVNPVANPTAGSAQAQTASAASNASGPLAPMLTQAAQASPYNPNALPGGGVQTLAAQDQQAKNAMALAQITGSYMPPQAQGLIQDIMNNKSAYANASPDQQKQLAAQNQQDYLNLSELLGKNVNSMIGSGVGLNQALTNMSRLGTPTLGAGQLALDEQKRNDQVNQFGQTLALDTQKEKDSNAYQMGVLGNDITKTNNDYSIQQQDESIKQSQLAIQQMTAQSDDDYKKWQENMGITQQQGQAATSGYTSQAIGQGSMQAAVNWLFNHASDIAKDGADMKTILASVESVYPGATKALTTAANSPLGNVNGAPVQGPTIPNLANPNLQP